MEVRVNTLPVRTWNWLSMNESRIKDLEMPDALRIESDGAFSSAIPPLPDMNTGMGIRLDEKVASHPIRVAIPAGDQQKIKVAIRGEAEKRGGQLIEIRAGRESELTVIMELTGEGQGTDGRTDSSLAGRRGESTASTGTAHAKCVSSIAGYRGIL